MSAYLDGLFSLAGRRAVVTGGAKGVGAMISTALAGAGAEVMIVGRGGEESEAFAAGIGATSLAHDLSTMDGVRAASAAIAEQADKLHILVNNAGTFTAAPLETLDYAQWDRELAI